MSQRASLILALEPGPRGTVVPVEVSVTVNSLTVEPAHKVTEVPGTLRNQDFFLFAQSLKNNRSCYDFCTVK